MQPVIFQELFDMTLDFLHNDVAALCSAGLVCKSWLPVSRFHLFSEILWEILDSARGLHVLELICAEGSTIPPYILKLKITDDENQILDEILLMLPLLSNVKHLLLMQTNMADLSPDAKMKITSWLKNLTTLDLYAVTFETVDQAVDFIASAPCLEDIGLRRIGCCESCESRNYSSKAVAPPLRVIHFEPSPLVDYLMEWFCRHPTLAPSVHTLDINRLASVDNILTVSNLIRHLGSSLEHLGIWCDHSHRFQSALSKQIDLSQNSSLRSIFFNRIDLHECSYRTRSCGWITSIISTLAHPPLELVTIAFFLGNVEEIKTFQVELSALENLFFNQPLSDNSTKLCLFIFGSCTEEYQAAFKERLPKLDGEKRLMFSRLRYI